LGLAQQRLWLTHQLHPDSDFYNVPRGLRLKGRLDLAALERSLNEIVRRHEVLRRVKGLDYRSARAAAYLGLGGREKRNAWIQ
jgi:hypothetical protein